MTCISDEILFTLDTLAQTELKPERYSHCLSVGKMLEKLVPELSAEDAKAIGLAHDIAHSWDEKQLKDYIRNEGSDISVESEELKYPKLLHAPVGAHILLTMDPNLPKTWYAAVRWHTLGHVSMGRLGLALYVADYIEPLRTYISESDRKFIAGDGKLEGMALRSIKMQKPYLDRNNLVLAKCTKELEEALEQGTFVL